MQLTYKTKNNRTVTQYFTPESYIGVDFEIHPMTEEYVNCLEDVKHLGFCGFKGDMFSGRRRDDEYYMTEIVIFFGTFEEKEELCI